MTPGATGGWSQCYSWVCVTPTVIALSPGSGISRLKMLLSSLVQCPHPYTTARATRSLVPHVTSIITPFLIITVSFAHYKHHHIPSHLLLSRTEDSMNDITQCLKQQREGRLQTLHHRGDSYWRSQCKMTALLPHDTMGGGTGDIRIVTARLGN